MATAPFIVLFSKDIFIAMEIHNSKTRRIAIIGSSGAGKSTLAQVLSSILLIKVIHLDRYFWKPDWVERSKEERIEILRELVKEAKWIIEGTYFSTSDIRLQEADTLIFLDLPRRLCVKRVIQRYMKYRKNRQPRSDLPDGCPDRLGSLYCLKIVLFWFVGRRTIMRKLKEVKNKNIIILRSPGEVKAFLEGLKQASREAELLASHAWREQEKVLIS